MSWVTWVKQFSIKEQAYMTQFCAGNENHAFDHAYIYGDYTTEVTFGKGFIDSGGSKSQYLTNF